MNQKTNQQNYGSTHDATKNEDDFSNSYEADVVTNRHDIINRSVCKCSYIIEPVVFIQNIASSIISISYSQFIYSKIFDRLLAESSIAYIPLSNSTVVNSTLQWSVDTAGMCSVSSNTTSSVIDGIRQKAQQDSASLLFYCSIYGGIPSIISSNLIGVNCTKLGRKTLLILSLLIMTIRNIIFVNQVIYPSLPDYLFYIGSALEGIFGSTGLYYLVLYCYIADITSFKTRSYRITIVSYISSVTYICVSYGTGYIIKYSSYLHIFVISLVFYILALAYTVLFVPEPLTALQSKSFWKRLRSCSFKRITNSVKVFKRSEHPGKRRRQQQQYDDDRTCLLDGNSTDTSQMDNIKTVNSTRQRSVLILIIIANVVYIFGANGVGAIFTLFLMNQPLCWDSIYISTFIVYSTITSLVFSLLVSKFLRINEILICILSISTFLVSSIIYGLANDTLTVYLACSVGVLSGLEYGYVRSIVSKLITKNEVSDALTFIACIDTISSVAATIIFTFLYAHLVSSMVRLVFFIAPIIFAVAILLHLIAYKLYIKHKAEDDLAGPGTNDEGTGTETDADILIANTNESTDLLLDTASIMSSQHDHMPNIYESLISSTSSMMNSVQNIQQTQDI